MRKLLFILMALLTGMTLFAQGGSGVGYDPTNPPDPQVGYRLTVATAPSAGGSGYASQTRNIPEGAEISLSAYSNTGYKFRAWMEGDRVISESSYFYYTMPASNVTLTAWFDREEYNPSNPGDPFIQGYEHRLSVFCTPSNGGNVSGAARFMKEGEETTIYAYPNSSYKFACWKQDGKIISIDPYLNVKMGKTDLEYTAQYVYAPDSPRNPGTNSWNSATGELIIDDFNPGSLWSRVCDLVADDSEREKVTSITVIGRMDNYDFGVVRNLPSLGIADFSRTDGATSLPWGNMEQNVALTKVVLPPSVTSIEPYAFSGCSSLSELVCYSSLPPSVGYDAFYGVPNGLVVKVYGSSLDLYQGASPWSDYRVIPIDEESTVLRVFLPEDASEGWYVNSSLQLDNLSTGRSQKLVITKGRDSYLFGNLIPDLKYSLYVLAPNGETIGKRLDFIVTSSGEDVVFTSLLHPYPVRLTLFTPDGQDVTDKAEISWSGPYGNFIGSGSELQGQVEGSVLKYNIRLSNDLATNFLLPEEGKYEVKEGDNLISIDLVPLKKVKVSGQVVDAVTGQGVKRAYVTVDQTVNGSYRSATTLTTDEDGRFSVEISDAYGSITAGSDEHNEASVWFKDLDDLGSEEVKVPLKPISGARVELTLLARVNAEKGNSTEITEPFNDYSDLIFHVKNLTTGRDIQQSVLRYPILVIMGEANEGDKVEITAVPRDGAFGAASATVTIKDNGAKANLTFISRGEILASYKESEVEEVVAILYDGRGMLAGKSDFRENKVSFVSLSAGDYTVVAMPAAGRLSGASSLDELKKFNLTEGKDYLEGKVKVENGVISLVNFDVIPEIDLNKFLYTDGETSVSVNKTSLSVNGIVTVRSKVKFLPEYADRIDKVKITFTIPEGCEYIENSLLTGGESNFTTIGDRTLSVDLPVKYATPRFCLRPLHGGDYRPSAVIEFNLDGRTIVQPIGSALFVANDFSISVPEKTSLPKITARGTATPQSDVRIYDNGVYMGSTHTQPNGDWRFGFNLFNPDRDDEHLIYAEITTKEGKVFRTSTGKTIYEKDWAELTDIIMMYGGLSISFNHPDATTKPGSYSYNPCNDMFSFKTVFRDDKTDEIERLIYVILLSDGSRREIEAKYLEGLGTWSAALGFPDVDRLPVNVKALYTEKRKNGEDNLNLIDNVRDIFRCPDVIPVIDPSGYVYEAVPSNRLQGATATIYYKELVEDMYGEVSVKATKWDAAEYAQENPQFTDEDGNYQWDVPQGEWQVRFEKEGYATFTTEWLPVPPPQLDVNVGLVQTTAPEVISVNAYEKGVELTFSKYMQPSSVFPGRVVVTAGGKNVEGSVVALDSEMAPDGSEYASKFRFVPSSPFVVKNVNVIVSKAVSYAGVAMQGSFEQDFALEEEVESIEAPEVKEIDITRSGTIEVTILPAAAAAGKVLNVSIDSPIAQIPSSVTINSEGKAKVEVTPELLGASNVTFTVEGVNGVKGVTLLRLLSEEQMSGVGNTIGESSLRIIDSADGSITVRGINSNPTVVEFFDLTGMRLMPARRITDDCVLSVGTLSPGVVLIKAVNNKEAVSAKIIVTR